MKLKYLKSIFYIQAKKQPLISIDLKFFYISNEIETPKIYPPVFVFFAPIVLCRQWDGRVDGQTNPLTALTMMLSTSRLKSRCNRRQNLISQHAF